MEPVEKIDGAAAPVSDEQKADLAALSALAGGAVTAEGAPQMPLSAQSATQEAEEWGALPAVVGSILAPVLPELRDVYTPAACKAWGEAMVPVARKYGWSASTIMGPEIALACASAPFVVGTVVAIKKRRVEVPQTPAEVQKEAPKDAPPPVADRDVADLLTPVGG